MNKEKAIKKINEYGNAGKIITVIMIVCVVLALVATTVASIAMFVMPDSLFELEIGTQGKLTIDFNSIEAEMEDSDIERMAALIDTGSAGVNLGVIRMKLDEAEVVGDSKLVATSNENVGVLSFSDIGKVLLVAVASLILTLISLIFANRLCIAFKTCESPFSEEVIKRMRVFAWSLLPWAVFSSVTEEVVNNLFGNNVEIGISLDMNIIFTVLVILALTVVFRYGAMLQQESDETL